MRYEEKTTHRRRAAILRPHTSYLIPHTYFRAVIAVLIAALALASACSAPARKKAPAALAERPNVLFISVDSLRADHLGCYGYSRRTSPNIDQLAHEGVRYARALAAAPWTLPSHMAMMTGQEPGVLGVDIGSFKLAENAPTIAKVLFDRGYRTAAVVEAPYLRKSFGFGQGFESYDDELSEAGDVHKFKGGAAAVYRALKLIRERRGERWFVFLHFWDVHYDYLPPAPFQRAFVDPQYRGAFDMNDWERNRDFKPGMDPADFAYAVAQYDGGIAFVDDQLGRLFAALKESGEWAQTAVILTSDHGDEFLDHGQKGHGHSVFNELLHVPLIVKAPHLGDAIRHRVPQDLTVDCPVGLIDIFPTIAELAGATGGQSSTAGDQRAADSLGNPQSAIRNPSSLLALARNPKSCPADREFFAETYQSNPDKFHDPEIGREMAIEKAGWKYCDRRDSPRRQLLFHVAVDPAERDDCLAREPDKADEMRALLRAHAARNLALRNASRFFDEPTLDRTAALRLKQLGYVR
jgi:arylsulfatase